MGLAIETIGFRVANPGATYSAVTMASGDSAVVRNFTPPSIALLEHVSRQGATAGAWRLLSAVLHDNVRGITLNYNETPSVYNMPDGIGEQMQPGDTLTIQGTGGTAETEVGAATIYYQNVDGLSAKLYGIADIRNAVEHYKPIEVDVTIGGTAGNWTDQLLNTTDGQQKADRKYAILGYTTDTAAAAIGIKGGEVGNVRICGPGPITGEDTARWFWQESERMGTPHIPVISANNFGSAYVSFLTTATSGTAKVFLNAVLLTAGF